MFLLCPCSSSSSSYQINHPHYCCLFLQANRSFLFSSYCQVHHLHLLKTILDDLFAPMPRRLSQLLFSYPPSLKPLSDRMLFLSPQWLYNLEKRYYLWHLWLMRTPSFFVFSVTSGVGWLVCLWCFSGIGYHQRCILRLRLVWWISRESLRWMVRGVFLWVVAAVKRRFCKLLILAIEWRWKSIKLLTD